MDSLQSLRCHLSPKFQQLCLAIAELNIFLYLHWIVDENLYITKHPCMVYLPRLYPLATNIAMDYPHCIFKGSMFHCYVSLPECILLANVGKYRSYMDAMGIGLPLYIYDFCFNTAEIVFCFFWLGYHHNTTTFKSTHTQSNSCFAVSPSCRDAAISKSLASIMENLKHISPQPDLEEIAGLLEGSLNPLSHTLKCMV